MNTHSTTGCWWQSTGADAAQDVPGAHPDIARIQQMTAEMRAMQLVAALRNAAEARVGWRQQARDLLHLIDCGVLPPVTEPTTQDNNK